MKKILFFGILAAYLLFQSHAEACVGRILNIGIPDSVNDHLLAEMVSLLINERTGSTVKIVVYKDSRELYDAVKQGKISLFIETTDRAMEVLGRPAERDAKTAHEIIKNEYRKNFSLVLLEPFGGNPVYSPVLTVETLANYPALPKLLNKLAAVLTNESCARLFESAKSNDKPKKIAKDFLKAKKLI